MMLCLQQKAEEHEEKPIREVQNSNAEAAKTLITWLQGRKCKQRVDSLNKKYGRKTAKDRPKQVMLPQNTADHSGDNAVHRSRLRSSK